MLLCFYLVFDQDGLPRLNAYCHSMPMHILGPLPNGQKLFCISLNCGLARAISHRSGFQSLGSWNTSGSMWRLTDCAETRAYMSVKLVNHDHLGS